MLSAMFGLVILLLILAADVSGFAIARRFVRQRLRFVDAVQRRSAPWIAGAGAFAVGSLVALLIPFVGLPAAAGFALAVGLGVSAGARDIRRGSYWVTDGR